MIVLLSYPQVSTTRCSGDSDAADVVAKLLDTVCAGEVVMRSAPAPGHSRSGVVARGGAAGAPPATKPTPPPRRRAKRGAVKKRMRSRNAVVDAWLIESGSDDEDDTFADLDEFIVTNDDDVV